MTLRGEKGCGPGASEENSGCEKWMVPVWKFRTSANKGGGEIMGKDKNVKKDTKKKPSKTLKEKQAAKRLKKTGKAGEV